jgi:hypothetical protein
MPSERRLFDVKATSQAQSATGDIDHLKITGGKGIYQQESVILNAAPLQAIYPAFPVTGSIRQHSRRGNRSAAW